MTESATSLREQKRWDTSRRITLCALRLTDQHGLDGFTMDDLAEAARSSMVKPSRPCWSVSRCAQCVMRRLVSHRFCSRRLVALSVT